MGCIGVGRASRRVIQGIGDIGEETGVGKARGGKAWGFGVWEVREVVAAVGAGGHQASFRGDPPEVSIMAGDDVTPKACSRCESHVVCNSRMKPRISICTFSGCVNPAKRAIWVRPWA